MEATTPFWMLHSNLITSVCVTSTLDNVATIELEGCFDLVENVVVYVHQCTHSNLTSEKLSCCQ